MNESKLNDMQKELVKDAIMLQASLMHGKPTKQKQRRMDAILNKLGFDSANEVLYKI